MKIVVLGNYTKALILFRGPLIKRFVDLGHTVIAYAPENDQETAEALKSMGAEFRPLAFKRTGTNAWRDVVFMFHFWRILSNEKPDILLSYTIKPVIFGSIAARLAGVRYCYSIITGLGYVFIGGGIAKRLLRVLVVKMYRLAISFNNTVFFLNQDDLAVFLEHGIISDSECCKLIHGEGVDVHEFNETVEGAPSVHVINGSGIDLCVYKDSCLPIPKTQIFLLIARLLKDKGVCEFVEAARMVKKKYPDTLFWIVGPLDSNPSAIRQEELQNWCDEGVIIFHGETSDVRPYIKSSTVYVLPSYREGVPRTVLEAMAMRRPVITTDAPGCRETVVNGDNGYLVPVKDSQALAHAMEQFIIHPELVEKMGRRSREIAEERFDVNKVNDEILRTMRLI
jgi:glycosyltransferase involved in cell wall biosynthesis